MTWIWWMDTVMRELVVGVVVGGAVAVAVLWVGWGGGHPGLFLS